MEKEGGIILKKYLLFMPPDKDAEGRSLANVRPRSTSQSFTCCDSSLGPTPFNLHK
jgi:hypothetical protein